jgi:hypothetical protein
MFYVNQIIGFEGQEILGAKQNLLTGIFFFFFFCEFQLVSSNYVLSFYWVSSTSQFSILALKGLYDNVKTLMKCGQKIWIGMSGNWNWGYVFQILLICVYVLQKKDSFYPLFFERADYVFDCAIYAFL